MTKGAIEKSSATCQHWIEKELDVGKEKERYTCRERERETESKERKRDVARNGKSGNYVKGFWLIYKNNIVRRDASGLKTGHRDTTCVLVYSKQSITSLHWKRHPNIDNEVDSF